MQRSTACSQARNAHHALGSSHKFHYIFVRLQRVCHLVRTSLTLCCSLAVHHEHIFFLTHPSFYHDTKTRTTIGTTLSTPRNTQCIINFSKARPVEKHRYHEPLWRENQRSDGNPRKPFSTAQRTCDQRACDCLKDLKDNRSISVV